MYQWGLMAVSKCLLEGYSKGKKWDPPSLTLVTPKLKVKELSQIGFWNISSHPTSVPSFSQIGWPQLLAPGTLSQTKTLKWFFWPPFFFCFALFAFKLGATAMLCLLIIGLYTRPEIKSWPDVKFCAHAQCVLPRCWLIHGSISKCLAAARVFLFRATRHFVLFSCEYKICAEVVVHRMFAVFLNSLNGKNSSRTILGDIFRFFYARFQD